MKLKGMLSPSMWLQKSKNKLYIIGVVLFVTILTSCRKNTSWNSDWVLPLINDTLDVSKFVNDSTIEVNGGFYYLNLKRNLYNFSLTDIVSIPDTIIDRSSFLNVTSLNVNPGFEFYNLIEEHELNLQDLELKKIELDGGYIDFQLENPVGTGVYITVELPGVTKNNVTLSRTFFIAAGSQSNPGEISETLDLSGYKIDLTGENGTKYNTLQSLIKIKTDPNGSTVNVTNNHVFNIKARFRDIKLHYARGYFGNRVLEDTANFDVKALNSVIAGSIDIQNASVKLILENGIKVDGNGIINFLKNTNYNTNNSVNLTGNGVGNLFTINQPTGSYSSLVPSLREIVLNSGNSNIEQFVENLGAKNEISYKLTINPWGNTSGGWNEVYPQSRLRLAIEAQMPLSIQMDALTISDTFAINIEQSKNKSHVESGFLQVDLDNAFPFSGKLKLLFLNKNGNVVEVIDNAQQIESSLYGSPNSQGLMHKKSTLEIPLNTEIVDKINSIKSIVVKAVFDTPNPVTSSNQMVGIPADAYLGIKAKAKFKLKMKI